MLDLLLASVIAVATPPSLETSEPLVLEGEHFRLICHLDDERAAAQGLGAVEAAWSQAIELYGDLDQPQDLHEVHLYSTDEAYVAAARALTGGDAFARNLAFAHHETRTAHVALQPPLDPAAMKVVGLPALTRRLLAHEAAHLIRFSKFHNFRSHPGWFADGMASLIDERVSKAIGTLNSMEEDPEYSTSILRVQTLIESDGLPSLMEILQDKTETLRAFERYDTRWMAVRFLNERKSRPDYLKVLDELRRLGGGQDFTGRLFEKILEHWSESKLAALDKDFRKYVMKFEPAWEQVYRELVAVGDTWVQSAFSKNAIAWRREPAGKRYTLSGELTILPGSRQQMNVLLGRCDAGFFSVAFVGGKGVNLFEYLAGSNSWERRGFVECADVLAGRAFAFSISVKADTVRVSVDGKQVIEGKAESVSLEGPWALSAQATASGIWKMDRATGI